jgi:hypothetical protein
LPPLFIYAALPSAVALAPPPKQPGRKKQQGLEQGEDRSQREANKSQRQGQQPDNGQENQREQRHGPAQHKKDAPQHKKQQDFHFLAFKFGVGHSTPLDANKPFLAGEVKWEIQTLILASRRAASDRGAHAPSRVAIGALADGIPKFSSKWRRCQDVAGGGAGHHTRGRVCSPEIRKESFFHPCHP